MNAENQLLAEFWPSPEEMTVLSERWRAGELTARVDHLLHFAGRHREEILRRVSKRTDSNSLVSVVQLLILESGTVHQASELKDQIKEIRSEIWYRGEKGPHEPHQIQEEWTQTYASAWRRWRLKEYIFVAERCATQLAARIALPRNLGRAG